MSSAYIGAIEDHCPNATLVLDHFHITKALNDAVDEVRKEEWRKASGDKRKVMKGPRWLLFKHSSIALKRHHVNTFERYQYIPSLCSLRSL